MRTLGGRRLSIVGVCAVVLVTAACGGSGGSGSGGGSGGSSTANASRGGTLNLLGDGDVDYMDPNISYYSVGYLGLRPWSRQLFTYPAVSGQTTTAVPDIATDMPSTSNGGISKDGKTYTISMRKGVMWNTTPARQVTAADVVRGVKRTCNPVQPFGGLPDYQTLIEGFQSFCAGFAKVGQTPTAIADYINKTPLPGVVAKDDTTVVFHLTHPATYFVDMLTLPAFSPAPEEVLKYLPASQSLGQHQISDGPYQIQTWTPTKEIVYTRNAAWKADTDPIRKAYVDKIIVNETVSQDSIQQQLQTGTASADMSFAVAPPPSQLPALIAKKDPNLTLGETASNNPYIVFNTVSPGNHGALGNVKVRQALELALNRTDMVQVLGGPTVNPPLSHILPPDISGSSDFDLYPFNASKAKQMLAAAGYPHGLNLKFLYRNSSEGGTKVFQTAQQELSNIGVKVTGVPSPEADFYTKYLQVPSAARGGVWDVALAGWGADWYGNAALSFFAPLFSGPPSYPPIGSNFGFYNNPKTTGLIQQATVASSLSQSDSLWNQADHQVMQDAAIFPITNPQQALYHATQVHNAIYIPAMQGYDPTNVWLDPSTNGG